MKLYLDTSAAMKLVVREDESAALAAALDALDAADRLVSSWLLHTELHCASGRRPEQVTVGLVTAVLESLTLVDLERIDLVSAPRVASGLRSQDALHLVVALRAGADTIATYDVEQAAVASSLGLRVLQPR